MMRIVQKKQVFATMFILVCSSCDGPAPIHITSMKFPLNQLTAELNLRIVTGDQAGQNKYCEPEPLKLCVGFLDNCYDIPDECRNLSSQCYDTYTECLVAKHNLTGTAQDDHPLANHPDDWDNLFLKNDSGSGFVLDRIWVEIDYTNVSERFTLIDEQSMNRDCSWSTVPLHEEVKAARIRAVESCLDLPEGGFYSLPKLIQQGAYDLGQGGIIKYKPWETGSQNGCDEFYAFFASQFSNNIHYSCTSDGRACTYFRNWETNYDHGSLDRSQFQYANRLAKVVFEVENNNRTSIRGIYRIDENGNLTDEPYEPKPGDFFLKDNHECIGNFHVMMYVGGYQDLSNSERAAFSLNILHKSSTVKINNWDIGYDYVNRKVTCAGNYGEFYYSFYFGEADLDVDPDGFGPLTSGARPGTNYSVTGPNVDFRSTQSAILSGTL